MYVSDFRESYCDYLGQKENVFKKLLLFKL